MLTSNTSIKIAAATTSSKQVCEPRHDLSADELALVTGGTPSAKPHAAPLEFMTFKFKLVTV
ncbi:MAG TPA: hypothetical protein VH678_22115 [Xanthobacteraceae bacterium]